MDEKDEKDEEKEQFIKQFEAGRYLKSLRGDRPLTEVCKKLEVSTAYLSEVERGKMPSDRFLSVAAKVYGVNEDDLFFRWGKIPILAQKEIKANPEILSTFAEIGRNKRLTDEQKQKFYDSVARLYRNLKRETGKKE